jgi:glycosyltransferase involved in cell wall biosynthesis
MKFAYMMRRVDGVVAGNRFLESEALPYNGSVEVIPTSVDLSRYHLKEYSPTGDLITLGWLGSGSTEKYIRSLLPTIEQVSLRYPHIQLKIVSDRFPEGSELPLIRKRWSADEEEADLKSFDIGLMPLANDMWSKGKCGLKILQYFGVGVPVVCSPIGVNRDIVEDGVSGYWAENEKEWEDRILKMIQERRSWKEMGLRGRERVEQDYSLTVNGPRILNFLMKVLNSEGRSG